MERHAMEIKSVTINFTDYDYRTPMKFGGRIVEKITLLDARLNAELPNGKTAEGLGSMPLCTTWGWPSKKLNTDQTMAATKLQAEKIAVLMNDCQVSGHPIDIAHQLEDEWLRAGEEACRELGYNEMMPKLNSLVTSSVFDAALHDAYGKLQDSNVYDCYSPDHMDRDISHYLDDRFKGEYLDQYTLRTPKESIPLYHLVGAVDPVIPSEVEDPVGDGLPEHLGEWIEKDRLTHLKIKLNGDDLEWDVERVVAIDRVAEETQQKPGVGQWFYSLDFNEKCENAEYVLAFLNKVEEQRPDGMGRVQYIEQPTHRDLKSHPENKMHAVAKIKPVVIDESLVDYEHFLLAEEMGYSGVALKACKGQSSALLMGAAAQKFNRFLCVQDLTCFGASFLHSAGLAARVPTVAAIEGNGRQYLPPAAYQEWADTFPEAYTVNNGTIQTAVLTGPGLGH